MRSLMRRYLTGIDWVINSMDYSSKLQTGVGNVSEIVLELNGEPDIGQLEEALNNFIRKFPLLNGYSWRGLNLCPYWKIYPDKKTLPVRINVTHLKDDAEPLLALEAKVNEPFKNGREHLVFHLVNKGERSFLGMTFDHRILDARGAEAFLELFQRDYQKEPLPEICLDEPAHLNRWLEKFSAGRQVNRVFLNPKKEVRTFPVSLCNSRVCKTKVVHFDPAQSGSFTDAAYAKAGYLMLMPYALAKSVQILHRIFEARGLRGSTYVIPVSIDSRREKPGKTEVFFNHASFFLFKIEKDTADNFPAILSSIKEQMYEQVKSGLPKAIENACLLLRIAPLPLVNNFLQFMLKNHFISFSFVGSAYNEKKFMDKEVQNICHLPRVPNPPGIGIFFNQFNNRINATLSYFEGALSDSEVSKIIVDLNALGDEE